MIMMNTDFGALVKRISPVLRRITYKLGAHHAAFNHEDLYQEAVMHLWEDFNAGELSDKTDSYILQGCFFCLKNHIRTSSRRVCMVSIDQPARDDEACGGDVLQIDDGSARVFIDNLHTRMLAEKIMNNGFSAREKEILRLCAGDFTMRQIGARLGVSHVMVIKSLRRIKDKCREYTDPA